MKYFSNLARIFTRKAQQQEAHPATGREYEFGDTNTTDMVLRCQYILKDINIQTN